MKSKFLFIPFALVLAACSEDYTPIEKTNGQVDLSGMTVGVTNDPLVIESRSVVDTSDYIVSVVDEKGATAGEWTYSSIPSSLTLPEGRYTLTVMSHHVQPAEWEHPYFEGTKTFTVTGGETTRIGEVNCTFASLKVSIVYSEGLSERIGDDAIITVSTDGSHLLEYVPTENRAGYFGLKAGNNSLIATFHGTIKGQKIEFRRIFNNIEAGQHRIITFSVKNGEGIIPDQTGNVGVQSIIDATMQEETVNGNLDIEEEVILPDGPQDETAITLQSSTIDFDKPNGVDGDSYVVTIAAPAGISNLRVKIDSDNDNFMQAVSDLLSTDFDLAYPAGRDEDFKGLNLPVGDEVIGATQLDVDISQFVPLLAAYPGTHYFTITVVDKKGNKLAQKLTFVS